MIISKLIRKVFTEVPKQDSSLQAITKECRFKGLPHWLRFSDPQATTTKLLGHLHITPTSVA